MRLTVFRFTIKTHHISHRMSFCQIDFFFHQKKQNTDIYLFFLGNGAQELCCCSSSSSSESESESCQSFLLRHLSQSGTGFSLKSSSIDSEKILAPLFSILVESSPSIAMPDSRRWRRKSRDCDWISKSDGDFEEEDVWGFAKDMDSSSCMNRKLEGYQSSTSSSSSSSSSASRRHPDTAPRMVPKANNTSPNLEPEIPRQSSAPLDVPNWSKIYGKNTMMGSSVGDGDGDRQDHSHAGQEEDEEEEDDDGEMVPPHEWIAKKLARSQISSFSVCEGVGRTLKGRDLSKVRNAVLTKTGFLE